MDILHWKQRDTWGREFLLSKAGLPVGEMIFDTWSSHDAVYTEGAVTTHFKKKGWLEQEVEILQNGERVGIATTTLLGNKRVWLNGGETYSLKSESLSSNRTVEDLSGNKVIDFKQGTWSFGNGEIIVANSLPEPHKEILVISSLYLKLVSDSSLVLVIVMFLMFYIVILN